MVLIKIILGIIGGIIGLAGCALSLVLGLAGLIIGAVVVGVVFLFVLAPLALIF